MITRRMDDFGKTIKEKIHIHIQTQGKRHLTIVEGLDDDLDLKRICKSMRKMFSCNGKVDEETHILQLQGDQRQNVKEWLLQNEVLTKSDLERLVIHGY
jgi:translation initiation factor SUI1